MSTTFSTKLRNEIEEAQKRRHDFIIKKFTFGGTLLGLGSLSVPISDGISITLLPLLYIVPLLAIAYDIYIVAEDFGIKRAGAFLRLHENGAEEAERLWEAFVNEHDRSLAPFGYCTVTMTFLLAAVLLLSQTAQSRLVLFCWICLTILIDGSLLFWSLSLRQHLQNASLPKPNRIESLPAEPEGGETQAVY